MIRFSGRLLRRALALALMLAVAGSAAIGALAWRLGQGPMPIDSLARLLEGHFNSEGAARITIGGAALAWEGFGLGVDRPLDIRLSDVRLFDRAGAEVVALPEGEVSLGLRSLLLGRIEPRAISLTGVTVTLLRDAEGAIRLDLGEAMDAPGAETGGEDSALFAELGLAPTAEGEAPARWSELRRLVVRQGVLVVEDRQLGARWTVPDARVVLQRVPAGRGTAILAEASGVAEAGAARLPVTARARLGADGVAAAHLNIAPVEPAALAAALPALAPLSAVEAMVSGSLSLTRAADGAIAGARLAASLGPGRIMLPDAAPIPLEAAHLTARFGPNGATLDEAALRLPGEAGPSPTLRATGHAAKLDGSGWIAEGRLSVDAVAAADLARFWPETVGKGARRWIVENITAGMARDLSVTLRAAMPGGIDTLLLDHAEGTLEAEGLTVHYLRPMPPVEQVSATLRLGLEEIGIATRGGRLGAITVPEGTVRLFDLGKPVERVEITLRVEAPLPDALGLLAHPRIDLLSRRPLPPGITGTGEATVTFGFPLLGSLSFDDIGVSATARTADGRLPALLAGRDFERARVEINVTEQGLRLSGSGAFGPISAEVQGEMDFRAGPATQVVERYSARVPAQEGLAALFGLDLAPYLTGPVSATASLETRRNGQGTATVWADLAQARVAVAELGAEKPPGRPGRAEGRLTLAPGGRLTGAELTRLEAGDIAGRARFVLTREGRLERIEVTEGRIGDSRLSGAVRLPQRPDEPHAVTLRAPVLDLSRRSPEALGQASSQGQGASPRVAVDATLDRVIIRPGHELAALRGRLTQTGGVIAEADVTARAGERGTISARIVPDGARRALALTADDAGAALNALNVLTTMAGGTLSVRGVYDDTQPGRPLSGEAEILDFRLREAPAGARVLQAMTLYGALELARGPGLSFDRAVASFTLTDGALELRDARAFGASLGFTAKGTLDRDRERLDLEGTIVPAYFFNSLLGHIPLIGRLFSPEQGGGVFAATYRVRGPLADPEVSVNPLAALTPGFLRGLFGLFERGAQGSQPAPADAPDRQGGG